jgi:hypothetical protein
MAASLSAPRTGRVLLARNFLFFSGTHFCYRLSKLLGLVRLEGLGKLKKSLPHGTRTRDLPALRSYAAVEKPARMSGVGSRYLPSFRRVRLTGNSSQGPAMAAVCQTSAVRKVRFPVSVESYTRLFRISSTVRNTSVMAANQIKTDKYFSLKITQLGLIAS